MSTASEPELEEDIQLRIRRPLTFKDELRLELTLDGRKCRGTTMRSGQLDKVFILTEEMRVEEESENDSDDGELRQLSLPSKTVDGKIVLEVYRGSMRKSAPVVTEMAFYNGELPSFGDLLGVDPDTVEPVRPWRTYTFHLSPATPPQSLAPTDDLVLPTRPDQHPRPFGYRQPPKSTRTPVPRPYHSSPILPSARLPQHAIFTRSPSPAAPLPFVGPVPDLLLVNDEIADTPEAPGGEEPEITADFFDFEKYDKDSNNSAELSPRYPPGSDRPDLDTLADAGPDDPPSLRLSLRVDTQPDSLPEINPPPSFPPAPSSPPAAPPITSISPIPDQQPQAPLADEVDAPAQAGLASPLPIPTSDTTEPEPDLGSRSVIQELSDAEILNIMETIDQVIAGEPAVLSENQPQSDDLPPIVDPLPEERQPPPRVEDPDIPDDLLDLINSVDVEEQPDIRNDAPGEGYIQQDQCTSDKSDPAAVEDVLDAIEPDISPPASPILDHSSPTPPPPPPSQRRRPRPRAPALTALSRIPVPFFTSSSPPPQPRPRPYRPEKTRRFVQPGNPPPVVRTPSSRPITGRTHDARYDDDAFQYRTSRRERSGSGVGRDRPGPPNTEGRESRSSYNDRVSSKADGRDSKRRRLAAETPHSSSPTPSARARAVPSKPRADPLPARDVIYISSGSNSPPVPTPAPISSVSDKKRKRPAAVIPVWRQAMFDPDEEMLRQIRREKKRREREAAGPPTSVGGSSREKRDRGDKGEGHGHRRKKEKKYAALNMGWGVPPPPERSTKRSRDVRGESSKAEGSKKKAKGTGWAADDVIDFTHDSD